MKKWYVALALAALAPLSFSMGNKPNEAKLAESAAASSAAQAASSAQASASSAAQATMSAASVVGTEAQAATDAERAEKAAKRAEQAASVAKATAKQRAAAHGGYTWSHFGVDPYAKSRDEAMKKRREAFAAMQLPQPIVDRLMKATEEAGEPTTITNGQRLDVMMEGKGARQNVLVAFVAPPAENMAYAAPAEMWQVTVDGTTYKVLLPKVCNNWSLIKELPPVKVTALPQPAAPPATSSGCPQGWMLKPHVWSLATLPPDLRREADSLIEAARQRESNHARNLEAYKPMSFSRLDKALQERVRTPAPVTAMVQVRFLDPQTLAVVRDLGTVVVTNGRGVMSMPEDPRPYVVETIWPGEFISPTISGDLRRLRVFGVEWGNYCGFRVNGAIQ